MIREQVSKGISKQDPHENKVQEQSGEKIATIRQ